MRMALGVLLVATAIGVGACCPSVRCPVAVSELRLRSDDIALPIQGKDETTLLGFLVAGGDRDVMGEDAALPDAPKRYGPMLKLLRDPANLDPEDLSNGTYGSWFHDSPTQQVIDSREPALPLPGSVYAVNDGMFWWVFRRPCGTKLARLVVFKSGPTSE